MKRQAVQYQGKTYRYILSLLNVFLDWLCPLQTKHSHGVKKNIKKTFAVHGMPETLQQDNGKEFKGSMKNMRMVQSRPYNPRAQGKVGRSHHVFRNKISFDMVTQTRPGTNWVKDLPNYMKCINNDKHEELGWQSPFKRVSSLRLARE